MKLALVAAGIACVVGCGSSSDSLVGDDAPGGGKTATKPSEGDAGGPKATADAAMPPCATTAGSVSGASSLNVRKEPNAASAAHGVVKEGAALAIYCQAEGDDVHGNSAWDYLGADQGYVSDHYVTRDAAPPPCTAALLACPVAQPDPVPPAPGDDTPPDPIGSSPPVDIEGPTVQPQVQDFANDVCAITGACTISTYEGHSPSADLAIDILISEAFGQLPDDDNALGEHVAAYALANQDAYQIQYVIFRQRINMGNGWTAMEDRGSITENHFDHVHVTFDP